MEPSKPEAVSVVVRVRPPLPHEARHGNCTRVEGGQRVLVAGERGRAECAYDRVLDMMASQEDVWRAVAPCVERALEGYNAALLTYGMTGSGKTHTMLGPRLMAAAFQGARPPAAGELRQCRERGLVPRVLQRLFECASGEPAAAAPRITLSYVQIYRERCYDLLRPAEAAAPLRVRERGGCAGAAFVEGLTEAPVATPEEGLERLAYGFSNVAFRATARNEQSSRSHCVLTLTLRRPLAGGALRESRVHLVDLAGNERWDTAPGGEMTRAHEQELSAINRSLHVLGACVQALSQHGRAGGRARHVPYRDSVLTTLLRECLSGNSFTTMLCTICSSSLFHAQTLSTLRFADRAKRLQMHARVSETADPQSLLRESLREVDYLRSLVAQAAAGGDAQERLDELETRNAALAGENRTLREQLSGLLSRPPQPGPAAGGGGGGPGLLGRARPPPSPSRSASAPRAPAGPLRRSRSEPALPWPDIRSADAAASGGHWAWAPHCRPRGRLRPSSAGRVPAKPPAPVGAREARGPPWGEGLPAGSGADGPERRERAPQALVAAPPRRRSRSVRAASPAAPQPGPRVPGWCPQGHALAELGASLQPTAAAAYDEWHCDSQDCASGSARTPEICRFHCARCQYDLCQRCHGKMFRRAARGGAEGAREAAGDGAGAAAGSLGLAAAPSHRAVASTAAAPRLFGEPPSQVPALAPPLLAEPPCAARGPRAPHSARSLSARHLQAGSEVDPEGGRRPSGGVRRPGPSRAPGRAKTVSARAREDGDGRVAGPRAAEVAPDEGNRAPACASGRLGSAGPRGGVQLPRVAAEAAAARPGAGAAPGAQRPPSAPRGRLSPREAGPRLPPVVGVARPRAAGGAACSQPAAQRPPAQPAADWACEAPAPCGPERPIVGALLSPLGRVLAPHPPSGPAVPASAAEVAAQGIANSAATLQQLSRLHAQYCLDSLLPPAGGPARARDPSRGRAPAAACGGAADLLQPGFAASPAASASPRGAAAAEQAAAGAPGAREAAAPAAPGAGACRGGGRGGGPGLGAPRFKADKLAGMTALLGELDVRHELEALDRQRSTVPCS